LVLYSAFSASSLEIRASRAGSAAGEVLEVVLLAVEEEPLWERDVNETRSDVELYVSPSSHSPSPT
jgi:hypothetical protein